MNEKNWGECITEGSAIVSSQDIKKANSLKRTAEGRIAFFDKQEITETNADYIFEGVYTSLIEVLHSLLITEGYKVSNHICLGYYLRDILNRKNLFRVFADLRYKRNSIIYYGKGMDFDVGKDAIEKCKRLIRELKKIIKEKFEKSPKGYKGV